MSPFWSWMVILAIFVVSYILTTIIDWVLRKKLRKIPYPHAIKVGACLSTVRKHRKEIVYSKLAPLKKNSKYNFMLAC